MLRVDREARGQIDGRQRYILYNHCNGISPQELDKSDVRSTTDFDFGSFMTPFTPHKADVTVMMMMYCSPGKFLHGNRSGALACAGNGRAVGGATIDQVIADHLHGGEPSRSIVLGHAQRIRSADCTQGTIIGRGNNEPVFPTIDPVVAHQQVFGVGGQDETLLKLRRSYLDFIKDDLQAFEATLPAAEQAKVQQYSQSIRELEQSFAGAVSGASCATTPSQTFEGTESGSTRNNPEYWAYMCDLAAAALACGTTRQATLLHGSGCSHQTYNFDGDVRDHHQVCHDYYGYGRANKNAQNTPAYMRSILEFHARSVVRIYDRLKQVPEAGGSMADSLLIQWMSDGGGQHHHGTDEHNVIFLGRGNGKLATERWVRYKRRERPLGEAHLTSALAVGLELETFGNGSDNISNPLSEVLT